MPRKRKYGELAVEAPPHMEYAGAQYYNHPTGLEMTLKGLLDTLAKFGVSRVEAVGQPFDPGLHEAVMCREDLDHEESTVLQETQTGYLLHDRLIRPAMVIVSQRSEAKEE